MNNDSSNSLESEPENSTQIEPGNDAATTSQSPIDGAEDSSNYIDTSSNIHIEPPDNGDGDIPSPPSKKPSLGSRLAKFASQVNIYLVLFILLILIGALVALMSYTDSKNSSTTANITSKSLSPSTLAQLANSNATVGGNGQLLNVESSAVFDGQVLVREGLDVAGNLSVGGTLALTSLTVSGTSQLGQTVVNKGLSVADDSSFQGNATVNKSLQVGGSGTFSGDLSAPQITTSSLQLNGDLVLDHHITAGGSTPTKSDGNALGSGGTSGLSGSDTAGSISLNTGGSPAAGCFITVNFSTAYSITPHVIVTPVGISAGGLNYYINRSSTSFSVCDATAPPANSSFGFDYFIVG
jgi:cytoskeletal protein CcmA (bactofilin family)